MRESEAKAKNLPPVVKSKKELAQKLEKIGLQKNVYRLSIVTVYFNLMNKLETVLLSQILNLADNWYRVATVLATVVGVVKVPRINAKAVAPDDHTLALRAVCVFQWV